MCLIITLIWHMKGNNVQWVKASSTRGIGFSLMYTMSQW